MIKELLRLLSDGNFHSGQDLADRFSVTRASIWKAIEKIRGKGIEIESYPKKGYKLLNKVQLLDENLILRGYIHGIKSEKITENCNVDKKIVLEILDSVDSTNNYLINKKKIIDSGYIVLSEEQISGRGRNGRSWCSPYGKNIYMSIYYKFGSNISNFSTLSLLIGITIANSINKYIHAKFYQAMEERGIKNLSVNFIDKFVKLKVKWPNDIYFNSKKLGGILIELAQEAEGPIETVIGIGINLYKKNLLVADNEVTSLETIIEDLIDVLHQNNKSYFYEVNFNFESIVDRNELIGFLLREIFINLHIFSEEGFKVFKKLWNSLDYLHGKKLQLLLDDNKSVFGKMEGIDDFGGLLLSSMETGNKLIKKIYNAKKVIVLDKKIED